MYVPEELILAVDGVCIGLCAGADVGADEAEKYIPRNTCALIKAFMGFKLAGLCPYVNTADLIVGETTCDGKKKAYELFDEITNGKMYIMELPNKKGEDGKSLWKNEVKKFAEKLESVSGKKITLEKLKEASKIVNDKRKALQRLSLLRANDPSPISGLDALLVNQVAFYDDPLRFTAKVNELCDELETTGKEQALAWQKKGVPGFLFPVRRWLSQTGSFTPLQKEATQSIVGEESCVGERNFRSLLDDNFSSLEEAMQKIAERYMTINCACFTPNNERLSDIEDLAKQAEGRRHHPLCHSVLHPLHD